MATLELQFNCLCLFVPDPAARVVHVLMPGTNGHEGHEHPRHVVRMLHHSFEGKTDEKEDRLYGRGMEGWALTLGPDNASADTSLLPPQGALPGGVLPDLSKITGRTLDPGLVGMNPGAGVAARITLRSGKVTRMASESTWAIGNDTIALAHQVTWRMWDVEPELKWEPLGGRPQTQTYPRPPLATLDELEPEDDLDYRLRIFHVTDDALPPRGGTLKPSEMRSHFRGFYPLLGVNDPVDELLPRILEKQIVEVNCTGGRAALPPTG